MKAARPLRIAAGISLLFAVGHAAGGIKQWSPMGDNGVLHMMTVTHFQTMGVNRSYLDFYMGFGWSLTIAGLLQSFLLWQMARIAARGDCHFLKPMIGAFALASLASAGVAWLYLFPIPAIFCGVLFLPLAAAYFAAN